MSDSRTRFEPLPGHPRPPGAAAAQPDLEEHGYVESELLVRGSAPSYAGHPPASFTTRVIVREPGPARRGSGVAVLEWFNVSSGNEAAPDYTYLGEELVRQGHVYVGVSAQLVGVAGGASALGEDTGGNGLRRQDPERYGLLRHPGDAYSYGIFTRVAEAVRDRWAPRLLVAVGQSQSAFALTRYVHGAQPVSRAFDGFLLHSRARSMLPWGEPGAAVDLEELRAGPPALLDPEVPVLTLQSEADVVLPRFDFVAARQPDTDRLRTWEVAGAAHADRWQIGDFEEFLGAPGPVNRGQQGFVARAALRALVAWCDGGAPPASAAPLDVVDGALVLDEAGNACGGVRTPCVDAPVATLSGWAPPGAPLLAALFGSTTPLDPVLLQERYADAAGYLRAYTRATDAAIAAGHLLAEDREAVLAQAEPAALRG